MLGRYKTHQRLLASVALAVTVAAFPATSFATTLDNALADDYADNNQVVVLYTNDVHGGVAGFTKQERDLNGTTEACLGYAGLASIKADATGRAAGTTLVDCGDSIQGSVIDTQTNGKDSFDLMKQVPYDLLTPGNHEFDFGASNYLSLVADQSPMQYLCANLTYTEFAGDKAGQLVVGDYAVKDYTLADGSAVKVAFVGCDTPESIAKSTPKYFQDDNGNYLYSFNGGTQPDYAEFYACIQKAVDAARAEVGQDGVVVLFGHLGDTGGADGWYSQDVIAHTTGIDVCLDGHSHSTIPGDYVKNADGKDVLRSSTGTKLEKVGCLTISKNEDGTYAFKTQLIDEVTDAEKSSDTYSTMKQSVEDVEAKYDGLVEVLGTTDFDLTVNNPDTGARAIRNAETNLGDFLTDAYLWFSSNPSDAVAAKARPADCAILNGGSIRANLAKGDINQLGVKTVFPWNTHVTEIEATGQQIVDCLEMGAKNYPKESGGFIQVSGITYVIDGNKPSKVVTDDQNMFQKVDGSYDAGDYRVHDVTIGGQPVNLTKAYNLVVNDYYYTQGGDGMTMFQSCKALFDYSDNVIDSDVIAAYLKDCLGGTVPQKYADAHGQGRITVGATKPDEPTDAKTTALHRLFNTKTGEHLYTADENEVRVLTTTTDEWLDEKNQATAVPASEGTPVWRLFDPQTGDHHYTADAYEASVLTTQQGWIFDFDGKPAFYSGAKETGKPVYRIYNTKAERFGHLFTSDAYEKSVWLNAGGWDDEGIAWYTAK